MRSHPVSGAAPALRQRHALSLLHHVAQADFVCGCQRGLQFTISRNSCSLPVPSQHWRLKLQHCRPDEHVKAHVVSTHSAAASATDVTASHDAGKEEPLTTETEAVVEYPNNLTVRNLFYFVMVPTLCYEFNYPRFDPDATC